MAAASAAYGYGHVSRGLSVVKKLTQFDGEKIQFLIYSDNPISINFGADNFNVKQKSFESFLLQDTSMQLDIVSLSDQDFIILDFAILKLFEEKQKLNDLLNRFKKTAAKLIFIDALGEQALSEYINQGLIDRFVYPYYLDKKLAKKIKDINAIAGKDFVILDDDYKELPKKNISQNANKILVTCGGSDPCQYTSVILNALNLIEIALEIRVIIGPLFTASNNELIKNCINNSKHQIKLIHSPSDLKDDILWCDLAIATSGMVKYELAAASTPAILVSIDSLHASINLSFVDCGAAIDMGELPDPERLKEVVTQIIEDYGIRCRLSESGRNSFDGLGSERLIKKILESFSVK